MHQSIGISRKIQEKLNDRIHTLNGGNHTTNYGKGHVIEWVGEISFVYSFDLFSFSGNDEMNVLFSI